MMLRGIVSLVCMVISAASSAQTPPIKATQPRVPKDAAGLRIKLVRTSCFGTCPDYSVEIEGDGTVTYEGHAFVKTRGMQGEHLSPNAVQELASLMVSKRFFSLRSFYGRCGWDQPSTVISIEWPGLNKIVTDCGDAAGKPNPAIVELAAAIDITVNSTQWITGEKERMGVLQKEVNDGVPTRK